MEVKNQDFKEKKKDAGTRDRGKTKNITLKKTHTNIKYINNTFEVNVNINFKTSFSSLKSRCHIDF